LGFDSAEEHKSNDESSPPYFRAVPQEVYLGRGRARIDQQVEKLGTGRKIWAMLGSFTSFRMTLSKIHASQTNMAKTNQLHQLWNWFSY
jgi:hypothetical protein